MVAQGLMPTPSKGRDHRSGKGMTETLHSPDLEKVLGGLLNPCFVEWMMGVPIGWTAYAPSAMEWSRWWWRMHSALSRLAPGS